MIKRTARLPRDEYRASGYRTVATPFFLLKTKKNTIGRTRIGIVIGRSVHKSAVKRNFWKRQAKVGLPPAIKKINDVLMIILPNTVKLTRKQFREEITKAAARIR